MSKDLKDNQLKLEHSDGSKSFFRLKEGLTDLEVIQLCESLDRGGVIATFNGRTMYTTGTQVE